MRRVDEIADALRRDIQSGKTAVDAVLPTESELQRQFEAGRSTIRRALDELIATGWASRLPNRGVQARLGSQGPRSSMIAFVDHTDTLHKTLFFSLGQSLGEEDLHVVHIDSTLRGTLGALEYAADSGFAAAVFWGKEMFLDRPRFAAIQSKLPVIAVDHCPNGVNADVVRGDHFGGAKSAVEHLIALGRQNIAISGFLTLVNDTRQRMLGYAAAHSESHLPILAHNFLYSSCVTDEYDQPRLFKDRLRQFDRPDAVFVLHDISVPAVAGAILDAGLRIPADVAIVGFGNDLPFTVGKCGLTTVALDWHGIAVALKERLMRRLNHPRLPAEEIVLPAWLVVRGSCGAPDSDWSGQEYQVSSATLNRRMPPDVWRPEFGNGGAKPPMPSSLSLKITAKAVSSSCSNACPQPTSSGG